MAAVPRIALIHATPLAIQPVAEAFDRLWPDARRMNLLDDRLSLDLAERGSLDAGMAARIVSLARYAKDSGAHAILFTCSAFGPAIDAAAKQTGLPTLKPNEAMFDEALDFCSSLGEQGRVGLVTTFGPAAAPMREDFLATAGTRARPPRLECAIAEGAMDALAAGDATLHDRLVVEAATTLKHCDVLMLGQFSIARSQAQVAAAVNKPVLASPDSAVRALQAALRPSTLSPTRPTRGTAHEIDRSAL